MVEESELAKRKKTIDVDILSANLDLFNGTPSFTCRIIKSLSSEIFGRVKRAQILPSGRWIATNCETNRNFTNLSVLV